MGAGVGSATSFERKQACLEVQLTVVGQNAEITSGFKLSR